MHCASCGAPSVLGASRCPRCLAPFGAAGPMSGMVLAEEEPPPEVPWGRWIGRGTVGIALLVSIATWAMRRVRGTPTAAPVVTVEDAVTPLAVDTPVVPVVEATPALPPPPSAGVDPTPAPPPTVVARPTPSVGDSIYRATTWVWLRSDPVNTSTQLGVVNPNQVVQVLERRFGWAHVRVDGQEGWMSAEYLTRAP